MGRPAAALLVLLLSTPALAAGEEPSPPSFDAFLGRFRAALAQNDADAVADLTRLPFLYEGEPRDRAAFVRAVYPTLFGADVRRCLRATAPRADGELRVIFCPPYAFYFGRDGGGFRLLEFGADGEESE